MRCDGKEEEVNRIVFSQKKAFLKKSLPPPVFLANYSNLLVFELHELFTSSRVAGVLKDERSGSDCVSFVIEWSFKTDLWNCWLTKSLSAICLWNKQKTCRKSRKIFSALMLEMFEIQRSCFRQKPHMMRIRRNISFRISQMRLSKQSFKIESSRTHPPDGRENLGNLWASMRWISW